MLIKKAVTNLIVTAFFITAENNLFKR